MLPNQVDGVNSDKNTIFEFVYLFLLQEMYQRYVYDIAFEYFLGQEGALESKRLRTTDLDGWQVGIPAGIGTWLGSKTILGLKLSS